MHADAQCHVWHIYYFNRICNFISDNIKKNDRKNTEFTSFYNDLMQNIIITQSRSSVCVDIVCHKRWNTQKVYLKGLCVLFYPFRPDQRVVVRIMLIWCEYLYINNFCFWRMRLVDMYFSFVYISYTMTSAVQRKRKYMY